MQALPLHRPEHSLCASAFMHSTKNAVKRSIQMHMPFTYQHACIYACSQGHRRIGQAIAGQGQQGQDTPRVSKQQCASAADTPAGGHLPCKDHTPIDERSAAPGCWLQQTSLCPGYTRTRPSQYSAALCTCCCHAAGAPQASGCAEFRYTPTAPELSQCVGSDGPALLLQRCSGHSTSAAGRAPVLQRALPSC
jgi:hypothetical protein